MSSYRSFSEMDEETDLSLEDDLIVSKPKSGQTAIQMPRGLAAFDNDYSIRSQDNEDEEEEEFIANNTDTQDRSKFLKKYVNGDEDLTEEERRQCRMHKIILLILAGGLTLFALILVFVQFGNN
jgi:hypothetical protein